MSTCQSRGRYYYYYHYYSCIVIGRFLLVVWTATYALILLRLHGALDDDSRHHHHQQQLNTNEDLPAPPLNFPTGKVIATKASRASSLQEQQELSPQQHDIRRHYSLNISSATTEHNKDDDLFKNFAQPSLSYVIDPADLWENDHDIDAFSNSKHGADLSMPLPRRRRKKPSTGNLPNWMKDYFRWHKETRRQMLLQQQQQQDVSNNNSNSNSKKSIRYLILTCPEKSRKCGGTADRLMSLPFLLLLAAKSHRLFLMHWGRPARLEEFLQPPVGGLDWRIPPGQQFLLQQQQRGRAADEDTVAFARDEGELVQMAQNSSLTVVQCRFQSHDHGSLYYDTHARQQQQQQQHDGDDNSHHSVPDGSSSTTITTTTTTTMQHVMRDVWQVCFTPAPPVAQIVTRFMNQHQIVPGRYMASHLRALYGVATRDESLIKHWSRNAVNCTILAAVNATTTKTAAATTSITSENDMVDESKLLFASDSDIAVRVAQRYGASLGINIIHPGKAAAASDAGGRGGVTSGTGPLHLDKTPDWRQRPPSDFYESFVDLLLMANARCVTYGMGGYGQLAAWLSWNVSCSMQHHRAVGVTPCQLPSVGLESSATTARIMKKKPPQQLQLLQPESVFYPPMPPLEFGSNQDTSRKLLVAASKKQASAARTMIDSSPNPGQSPPLPNLWDDSSTLPQWMKDYFVFHQESRKQLSRENWNSSNVRYLIVECMESAEHCGGTADRLRPIPFYVRLAAETHRLLFLSWDKPKPLEAFLLPPVGGVDWRLPSWFHDEQLGRQTTFQAINKLVPAAQDENRIIVQARIQAHDHGSEYYNTKGKSMGDGLDSFREHYHDCWHVLFTPVPAIARVVADEMEKLHLVPGEFAVAHLRALYGIELQQDGRDFELYIRPWAQNALNCLSSLRPGGPFLFSSDSDLARHAAVEYGRARNTTVVARLDAPKPLHLDLVADWAARNASDFYDAFVDLFLMSFGRCMSYNMGGYGKWAQLISGRNLTCNIRHWTKGVNKASANKEGCKWTEPTSLDLAQRNAVVTTGFEKPLFLPPMKV